MKPYCDMKRVIKYSRKLEKLIPEIKDSTENWRFMGGDDPGAVGLDCPEPYARRILDGLESKSTRRKIESQKIRRELDNYKGMPFVDLGAGKRNYGYLIACKAGASSYIGVECHFPEELRREIKGTVDKPQLYNIRLIPFAVVAEPILVFLRRLPNQSVNTFASGIDEDIIYGTNTPVDETSKEIERVLLPRGIHFSYNSEFRPPNLNFGKLESIYFNGLTTLVFRKK